MFISTEDISSQKCAECNPPPLAPQPDLESEGYKPSLARGHFKSEVCRVQHSAKMAAMDSTKTYIPLLPFFLLGAAIDLLSLEMGG